MRRSLPIRTKLVCYFLVFAAVLLSILWVFQVWAFDDVYRFVRSCQLEKSALVLADNIGSEEVEGLISEVQNKNSLSVGIYKTGSRIIYEVYASEDRDSYFMPFKPHEIYGSYALASEYGGRITLSNLQLENEIINRKWGNILTSQSGREESIISATLVKSGSDEYMVLTKAPFAPSASTVETMTLILLFITGVFVFFAVALAICAAYTLSKPIRSINKSARELARQNYGVTFDGKGSRETEELSATLNNAASELSKVDALRRELISNVSHDLRTPLTMIGGYAEVMRDIPGENTPENLQIIVDETEHLSALVTDILSLSKLEAGAQSLNKSEFSLTESINSIFARYSKFVQNEELTLRFEADRDVRVFADELKLSQVIYNLINNAINYSLEPKAVLVRQKVNGNKVLVEIIDNGKGIKQDEMSEIWDRYYRAKENHQIATVGTGLGLSIVKKILLLHGARFGVKSREGVGSNFWFEIECLADE